MKEIQNYIVKSYKNAKYMNIFWILSEYDRKNQFITFCSCFLSRFAPNYDGFVNDEIPLYLYFLRVLSKIWIAVDITLKIKI